MIILVFSSLARQHHSVAQRWGRLAPWAEAHGYEHDSPLGYDKCCIQVVNATQIILL